ncbi:MFS transporter [Arsenicicoccus sp. oral taxon 190]|uniref:MFS transporter n=1 Tax=Arsenicicoccus sp. oral taxon 190 TaxID=1658671 RepID=UPI00209EBD23|nr:MFS transporter [Arsenicicoccus sp. oral taxon 190]
MRPDPRRRPHALLTAAAVGVLLAAADTYVVVLALPDMMTGVGLGVDAMQRATPIVSGFLLGYVATLPLVGRLADLVDRRRVLQGLLAVFLVGSVVTALAVELPVLVAGRVLQGLGGGGLVPATLALVAGGWPPDRRGVPLGVVGAVQELGSVLGPLLGAAVLAVGTWRDIFWLNAVAAVGLWLVVGALAGLGPRVGMRSLPLLLGLVALALALWAPPALVTDLTWGWGYVPLGGRARVQTPLGVAALLLLIVWLLVSWPRWRSLRRELDLVGAGLAATALGCLVLTFATSDPAVEVVGRTAWWWVPLGLLAAIAYAVRHRTAARPLVARGVVRGTGLRALVVSLLVGAALAAVVVDVPVLARLTVAQSQAQAAFVLLRFLVGVPVGALAGGALLRRLGPAPVATAGVALAAVGLADMARWGTGSLATPWSTVSLLVVGLGLGLAVAPVNAAALDAVEAAAHGITSSLVVLARMMGMIAGLALLTAVGLRRFYAATAALPDPTDPQALLGAALLQVQTVFWGAAACCAVAAVVALTLGGRRTRPAADGAVPQGTPSTTPRAAARPDG